MSDPTTVDVFDDSQAEQVSIKIFYPDGTVAVFNDPQKWGHNQEKGKFWIQTDQGIAEFYDLPHEIVDKRPRDQQRPRARAIRANY